MTKVPEQQLPGQGWGPLWPIHFIDSYNSVQKVLDRCRSWFPSPNERRMFVMALALRDLRDSCALATTTLLEVNHAAEDPVGGDEDVVRITRRAFEKDCPEWKILRIARAFPREWMRASQRGDL